MELFVNNSLTRSKELFVPLMKDPTYQGEKKDFVGLYSCGPTVYGTPTIGNLRTFLMSDILKNTVKYFLDLPVKHVMNITDVGHLVNDADEGEDKMEKGSKREGLTAWDIALKYEKEFMEHLGKMNIGEIDYFPTATAHIPEQISMINVLTKKGHTYVIDGDGIYFDTSTIDDYGKLLTSEHLEGLKKGARVEGLRKKNPTDFALWKFSPKGQTRQMKWIFEGDRSGLTITDTNRESLTETERQTHGFPGWHIECSAMAIKYLGTNFDFHTGGMDLKPVHHPNEICQAEHSLCDHGPWVKYWLHGQFITVNGEKMGKSLGNAYTLNDIENKGYTGVDLRYFYFLAHYANFLDFTREGLERASKTRKKINKKLSVHESDRQFESWGELKSNIKGGLGIELIETIEESLGNDLNVPQIIAQLNKVVNDMNQEHFDQETINILSYLDEKLLKLGLFDGDEFMVIPPHVIALADQRLKAKTNKQYALADELRQQIHDLGYTVRDANSSYTIEPN